MDYNRVYIFNTTQLVNLLQVYVLSVTIILSCCFARDTIEFGSPIYDNGETLVSAGERFELGFFTPNGSLSMKRYVGIWYKSSPNTVVWVANRDKPLPSSAKNNGVFGINDNGNLQVWDESNMDEPYWSTEIETLNESVDNLTAKLMDSGNLVFGDTMWKSFEYPTDTFLPGMNIKGLKLTSWKEKDDPALGDFSFELEREERYVIVNKSVPYWKSGGKFASSNTMPDLIPFMLSNFSLTKPLINSKIKPLINSKNRDYYGTRLVIMFNGRVEYHLNSSLKWFEPVDQCSVVNACGDFGSCDAQSSQTCKCLPGFKPVYPEQWSFGDFSGGCTRKGSRPCGNKILNLKSMNAREPDSPELAVKNETECRKNCLEHCQCNAYSFRATQVSRYRRSNSRSDYSNMCLIWSGPLYDLQKDYVNGRDLHIRLASTDLGSTKKNCDPCGTSAVPYPLSTEQDCGDPKYFSFKCDRSSEVITFKALDGDYRVVNIDQDTRKFIIEVQKSDNCEAKGSKSLRLPQSSPFNVTNWCYTKPGMLSLQGQASFQKMREVEIQWDPPPEPVCSLDSDCEEWPNTSCTRGALDGKKRCLCNTNYEWDGLSLNCTQSQGDHKPSESSSPSKNSSFPLVIVLVVAMSVVALVCAFAIWFFIRRSKKLKKEKRRSDQRSKDLLKLDTQNRISHLMNSGEFVEEDGEGIDVPFFDFDTIIAATDEFSHHNKLGQGGYGPVYKATFQGGQEMAVKRLSSASGQGLQEFKNEVVLIAKLQHRNLVKLRGYCIKGDEKILLYEYMPNRSLDSFIFDEEQSKILDWDKRFNIILGIARGLLYLHQDSRLRIIHRDFKTSNILLDEDMEPKISDFGLARIFGGKQTEANTERVVGTYGYMSPEYALEGIFSVKSDVFSFGVVLLEIISGKRNTRLVRVSGQPLSLLGYAWRLWTENYESVLMDPSLVESCNDEQFLKCVKIALLCVQEDPNERPNMSTVVTMLDSDSENVPNPLQPAFVLKTGTSIGSSSSSTKPQDTQAEITVTLEQGR